MPPGAPPGPADAVSGTRTFVVGDVHGCAAELGRLLARAGLRPGTDHLVLVGDLFAKGPDPVGVARLLDRHLTTVVLGNHDLALLKRRAALAKAGAPWQDPLSECARRLESEAPGAWARLDHAPLHCRTGGVLVVHAGFDPARGVQRSGRDLLLTVRRLPDRPEAPFWWERWRGPETVVFGHDARRGLVWHVAGGRVVAVGLDTGCVYGGRLTGLFTDTLRLVSVPADRAYVPLPRPAPPGGVSGSPGPGGSGANPGPGAPSDDS